MKLRFFLGVALAWFTAVAAHAQSSLSSTGITANPGTTTPGGQVSFQIAVSNSGPTQFGPGAFASFTVVLTNPVTGSTFTVGPLTGTPDSGLIAAAATNPSTGLVTPGTGTFTLPAATVPLSTTQAGTYSATVTINSVSAGGINTPTFSVSSTVLTVTGNPDFQITSLSYAAGTSYVGGAVIPMKLTFTNNVATGGLTNVPWVPGVSPGSAASGGGAPTYFRIEVVLSSNPTFGDADDFQLTYFDISAKALQSMVGNSGKAYLNADGNDRTITWNQVLPGNFSGSYYVLAKINMLTASQVLENDPPVQTVNGNNVWEGNSLNPSATLINLLPSTFPATSLVSQATGVNTSGNGYSDNPSITADGRYVAFASDASNLVAGDTNGQRDIFYFDSQTSLVHRVSLSQQGAQGNGASNNPSISSASGLYIAFESLASNLVVGDTNGFSDIFVVNTLTGLIAKISGANAVGGQANNPSFKPSISQDGRYVVFQSTATNLTATATAVGVSHVYVYNRDVSNSGTFDTPGNTSTQLVDVDSTNPATVAGNSNAIQGVISSDASWIAFASTATNLVAGGTTAGIQHVYVRPTANTGTGTSGIKLVSVANGSGAQGNANSQTPSLSSDGHYVAFASLASNLVAGDTNGVSDIFVYDNTQPVGTPVVRRMSVPDPSTGLIQGIDPSAAGFQLGSINPTISADGRYVAFASLDNNLTRGDSVGQWYSGGTGATATATIGGGAVTAIGMTAQGVGYNTVAPIVLITGGGAAANGAQATATINGSGQVTGITVTAGGTGYTSVPTVTILSGGDQNAALDIFVHDRDSAATGTFDTGATATALVSVNSFGYQTYDLLGVPSTAASNIYPVISSSGRFVALPSDADGISGLAFGATNELPLDTNGVRDVFIVDRRTTATITPATPPTVNITSPGSGSSVLVNTAIPLTASATTTTGVVASVQFFVNGVSLGTSTVFPYSQTWTPTAVGTYTLSALVTDSFGNIGVSPNITVTVNAAPSVGLTAPVGGTTILIGTPTAVTASASATTPGATITGVQFFANGVSLGTSAAAPYSVSWTPSSAGTVMLTAIATDSLGDQSTSAPVSVTISAGSSATTPPGVALSSPLASATYSVGNPITVAASASLGGSGVVTGVQFFVNGVSIGSTSSLPFSISYTPTAAGSYSFTAVATDSSGNTTTSPAVVITVAAAGAPAVAITAPTAGTVLPVNVLQTISATASSATGSIASVQFFANSTSVGTVTVFPFQTGWTPTSPGTYTLTAVATDSSGRQTTSSPVTVTATAGGVPTVSITSPTSGTSISLGSGVTLAANALAAIGSIAKVQFFANSIPITGGTLTSPPYSVNWVPGGSGVFVITAVATDTIGNSTTSAAVTVIVTGTSAPTVAVTAPSSGSSYIVGNTVTLAASATASSGTITQVQFLANGIPISGATNPVKAAPYTFAWQPTSAGVFSITAVATDSAGNTTVSAPISVSVTSGVPPVVAITNPPSGTSIPLGNGIQIAASASSSSGFIKQVQFFANGGLITGGTVTAAPYSVNWVPSGTGVFTLIAVATDNIGNVTSSSGVTVTVGSASSPTVSITSPSNGSAYIVGSNVAFSATASASGGIITQVNFLVNGIPLATGNPVKSPPYTLTWQPPAAGTFVLTAVASSSAGLTTVSAPVTVTVSASPGPTVSLTNPVSGSSVTSGVPVRLTATAGDAYGTVTSVQFMVSGVTVATASAAPYTGTWTPTLAGTYSLVAEATDSFGNITVSSPATVTVLTNPAPIVTITSPLTGSVVGISTGIVLNATASSPNGSVASVQFFVNGVADGPAITASPYTTTFSPPSAGIYTIVAVATDNAGAVTTSSSVTVEAASSGAGATVYTGNYSVGLSDNGKFAFVTIDGQFATFIAHSSTAGVAPLFFSDLALGSSGAFSANGITGTTSSTGVSGTFDGGKALFIGGAAQSNGSTVASGYYTGSISGQSGSQVTGIVGPDGSIMLYVTQGTFADAGDGILDSTGAFTITTVGGNKIVGKVSPTTGFLTATLTGGPGGAILGARVSGGTFSDGTLRNLSTRGQVGTGSNIMIAGFVVGGAVPKQLLLRAIGPTLTQFSVSGALTSTQLSLFNSGGGLVVSNQGWSTGNATAAIMNSAGAFALPTGSGDSALVATLAPGSYTAQMSGVSGLTGVGLVEIYDLDQVAPFSTQKLTNVSTRGTVGTQILIGGLVINGSAPKRMLVRGVGPTLGTLGVSGALSTPVLRIYNSAGTLIRENTSWQTGNDSGLVTLAESQTGAFTLGSGSADSVLLIVLPPGSYSAQVSSTGSATGTALIEMYEVP